MTLDQERAMLSAMKVPEHPTTIVLNSAVDLLFEIYLLRGDCSLAAKAVLGQKQVDHAAVEEFARLDDALSQSYRSLQGTLKGIQRSRSRPSRKR